MYPLGLSSLWLYYWLHSDFTFEHLPCFSTSCLTWSFLHSTARVICTLVWPLSEAGPDLGGSCSLITRRRRRCYCKDGDPFCNWCSIVLFFLFLFCGNIWSCSGHVLLSLIPFDSQDGTANDVPTDLPVEGYPMIYFYSTTGDLHSYNGGRTAEDILSFIKKNKGPRAGAVDEVTQTVAGTGAVEEGITPSSPPELLKDELWSRCHM